MTDVDTGIEAAFDPFSGAYYEDPAGALAWARRNQPVLHSKRIDSWLVTRYTDIRRVFRDTTTFSARNVLDPIVRPGRDAVRTLARNGFGGGPVLANEDEPVHGRRRRRLLRPLSRPQVAAWELPVRSLVTSRIDRIVRRGQAELMSDLLWDVPARVVYAFLGVADDELDEAMTYAVGLSKFTWGEPTPDEQVAGAEVLSGYWQLTGRMLRRRHSDGEATGWLGHAMRAQERGCGLFDDTYLRALVMNGSTAGHETVANGAANAIRTLLEHAASWRAVCANPRLVPNAVEECLRFRSPVVSWRRYAVDDAVIGDARIPAGSAVLLVTASGNHDDAVFADPGRLDIRRRNARAHLSFGHGNHRCIGATLARLQLRVILEECGRRLPHLALVPGQRFDHVPNTSFFGPRELHVTWDPAANPVPGDRP